MCVYGAWDAAIVWMESTDRAYDDRPLEVLLEPLKARDITPIFYIAQV